MPRISGYSVYTNVHGEYRLEKGEPVLVNWDQIGWTAGNRKDGEALLAELKAARLKRREVWR